MANYYSFLVTQRTFRVKDLETFKTEIGRYTSDGNSPACPWSPGDLILFVENDDSIWLGGYDVDLSPYCEEEDDYVDVAEIIQRHLADSQVAVLYQVGYEKLRYVTGDVIVITPKQVLCRGLSDLEKQILTEYRVRRTP